MQPKISIITVCYNSEKYLRQCIESIVSQPYDNLEYIVIDGGSNDNTLSIIEEYKDRISYFISEPDNGISDAFNKGIKASTGDLIGIVNSDDYMMPDVLNKVAAEYDESYDVLRGYEVIYYPTRNKFKEERPNNRFGRIPIGNCICHEASFIRKSMYDKVGLYKIDLKYTMDIDLFMRMHRIGAKHKIIDVCVLTFRAGGASSSINKALILERQRLIRENGGGPIASFIYVNYHKSKQWVKKQVFKFWPK